MGGQALGASAEMLDRLDDLLRRARAGGAVEADAFMVEEELQTVQVRLGSLESLKHARENRCSLRVFTESGCASATTSDLSPSALARLVDESVRLAQVARRDEHSGLPAGETLAREVPDLDLWDPDGQAIKLEDKIDWARRAEAAALEADARVRNSEGAEFYDRQGRVAYASSGGFAGGFRVSSFAVSVTPVASDDGDMERDYWYTSARHLAHLEPPEAVGREAARRAVRRLGARKGETVEVPVIFDPETAGSLIRGMAVAASGPGLYRGTSFLIGQRGRTVASPLVTIVDDPLMPRGLGSRPFDGEGLPSRRTVLVDHGVLASYLLDTYSARRLGLEATGHAARENGGGVTVGYTNLYLAAGPWAPEEILRSVDRGLYVTELIGFGVNFATGDYSRGAVGFWIENGELAHPVEEITIAGNLRQMMQNVEMVGRDLAFRDQTAAPTLKISRLTVAGQ
ncbi:MAG TPA: TldD/PmbA family protein [Methylomirabilota bacterium]